MSIEDFVNRAEYVTVRNDKGSFGGPVQDVATVDGKFNIELQHVFSDASMEHAMWFGAARICPRAKHASVGERVVVCTHCGECRECKGETVTLTLRQHPKSTFVPPRQHESD